MSKEVQNRLLVSRMLRRHQQMAGGSFQFSLRSLLISITFFCLWLGLVCFLTAIRPRDISLPVHCWITALWGGIIVGAVVSRNAWYYFLGGAIGNALASPLTLVILAHDRRDALPFITFWWMSFVFAACASLVGGIYCVVRGKLLVGIENIIAFVASVVVFVAMS
jgi:hypothetical protein